MSNWLKGLLALSLFMNLAGAGFLAGQWMKRNAPASPPAIRTPIEIDLPKEARRHIVRNLGKIKREARPSREDINAAKESVIQILGSESPSQSEILASFSRFAELEAASREAEFENTSEFLASRNQDERAFVAELIKRRGLNRPPRRRGMEGRPHRQRPQP